MSAKHDIFADLSVQDSSKDAFSPAPLLPFPEGCRTVRLIGREKRFFALCRDESGTELIAHTNNTGSMLGLLSHGINTSRLDALITDEKGRLPDIWAECKNVSMCEDGGVAFFPDAVSERGAKHLCELERLVSEGHRAAMLYVIQRTDARCFSPADFIDKAYAQKLREAVRNGVEAYAVSVRVTHKGVYPHAMPTLRLWDR